MEAASPPAASTPIGGPEKSRAIYGYLADGIPDVYTFTSSASLSREVRLIVPAYPEHADFRPTLVLEADGQEIARARDESDVEREEEFEPFSLTWFWSGARADVAFEPDRQYAIRVEPGQAGERSGRFVLVVSGPEEFSGADALETALGLPRIWFGAYGGAPWRWNWLALIPITALAAAITAAARIIGAVLQHGRPGGPKAPLTGTSRGYSGVDGTGTDQGERQR